MHRYQIYFRRQRSSLKADTRRLQFSSVQCPQGTECRSRQSAFNLNGRIMKIIHLIVYRASHQQSETGKVGYIGCTKLGLEARKRDHLKSAHKSNSSLKFHRALRKYKDTEWKWEILQEGYETRTHLFNSERDWIAKFKSNILGYNETSGGEGSDWCLGRKLKLGTRLRMRWAQQGKKNHFYGKHHTPEALEKIAAVQRGRKHTLDHRLKNSIAQKNRPGGFTGYQHTEDERRKTSESMRRAWTDGRYVKRKTYKRSVEGEQRRLTGLKNHYKKQNAN